MSNIVLLVNPASGSGTGGRSVPKLLAAFERLGVSTTVLATEGPGDGVRLARQAVALGADKLLVVGGDGTIHEVVNGLLTSDGQPPPFAVAPMGTGNDFYRIVGAPKRLDDAVRVLMEGRVRQVDVGRARWDDQEKFFVNLMGVGLDVEVLLRRSRVRVLSGLAQYLVALAAAVVRFRPVPVRIRLESGEEIEAPTMLSAVTVGPSAGGGFLLNPTAVADDGLLDLCFVDRLNLFQVARYIPKVIRGTHSDLPVIRMRRFQHVRFSSPDGGPLPFELDGELMPAAAGPIDIDVLPGRIGVFVPAEERP
ncbi:MAG: diacylglycerol kinase family lipid kinase [Gemmatimonadota bacterium]